MHSAKISYNQPEHNYSSNKDSTSNVELNFLQDLPKLIASIEKLILESIHVLGYCSI